LAAIDADTVGRAVLDARGERIGQLSDLYADVDSGKVSFGGVTLVRHGRRRVVFVALADATVSPNAVTVKCGKDLARRAPSVRPGESLPAEAEQALFAHYDIPWAASDRVARRLTPFD
jgi:sporulation protein YlmC with PRC-barrel domain